MATKENLDRYDFSSFSGFNAQLIRWRYEELAGFFKGSVCLELGSADGQGTEYLLRHFNRVVAVDGSKDAIVSLKKRFKDSKLEAIHSYFEELKTDEKFDTIVLAHILEHVDNPDGILKIAKSFLKSDGILIIDVPNGMSLHRQIGVQMGMLKKATALNEADHSIGHKRVYTPETFQKQVRDAGLKIQKFGGIFLKVLSNGQMDELFNDEQKRAFLEIGKKNPELASEIYIVAGK